MPKQVLTTGSTVTCPHQLAITFTSSAALHVGSKSVVRSSDIANAVLACTADTKCTKIDQSSSSEIVRSDGEAVVLASGLATNIGPCTVVAGHDLLQTD